MIHFLLVFDRRKGALLSKKQFNNRADAMAGRFESEQTYRENPEVEVVVLGADSEEALRSTHSRYFEDPTSIWAQAIRDVIKRSA